MTDKTRRTANLVSSSNLYVDSSADKIGIGTTNPTSKLHIVGDTIISGVITATSLSLDGQTVSSVGVGIATAGGTVGTGVTLVDLRGAGISTVTVVSGIATINITGGGGEGTAGVSSTGILTCRGIANADEITSSITFEDFYGTGTNYAMIGPITVTGSDTTVTVGVGVSYVII